MTDKTYPPVPGSLERYREVAELIQAEDRPVAWGRYLTGTTAAARVNKLPKHKNNEGLDLRFAQRAFADDIYIFAYITDEQLAQLGVVMTYDMWRDTHGFPDDLQALHDPASEQDNDLDG